MAAGFNTFCFWALATKNGDTLVMGPVGKQSQGMMGAVPEKSP